MATQVACSLHTIFKALAYRFTCTISSWTSCIRSTHNITSSQVLKQSTWLRRAQTIRMICGCSLSRLFLLMIRANSCWCRLRASPSIAKKVFASFMWSRSTALSRLTVMPSWWELCFWRRRSTYMSKATKIWTLIASLNCRYRKLTVWIWPESSQAIFSKTG